MAIKINLLPTGSRVSGNTAKFLRATRMLGVISLAVFIVFALGLAAFFIFSTVELNNLNSENDSLKSQVSSLQATEAQLVVLKDRLAKIKTVQKIPSAVKNLTDLDPYVSSLAGSSISSLDIDTKKMETSINFRSNSDLTNFIKSISESTVFENVTISSFNFSQAGGYLVSLTVASK